MIPVNRRELLRTTMAVLGAAAVPGISRAAQSFGWSNWSGGVVANPVSRVVPADEDELIEFLKSTQGAFRPVGAGHSFVPLVPTSGHLLSIDRLRGVLEVDGEALRATVAAGTRLGDMGPMLAQHGQASINLPDIDRQTLAGALATSTHGTGDFCSTSGDLTGLRLVSVDGAVHDVDAAHNPDLFHAAAVSLGALGVLTAATLQNRTPLRLRARSFAEPLEDVLAAFDERTRSHRQFEFFPLPWCDWVSSLAIDETDAPIHNPPPDPEAEKALMEALRLMQRTPLLARPAALNAIFEQTEPEERVDASHRILTNVRLQRFNEMEYSVPAAVGMDCVAEVLQAIRTQEIDIVFPLEVRYVAADDHWLSMFEGGPRVSISIHDFADRDYRPYFDAMEKIFLRYGGRPHWGKVHSLGYQQLRELYPRLDDFRRLRAELDPNGRLLNAHLRQVLNA